MTVKKRCVNTVGLPGRGTGCSLGCRRDIQSGNTHGRQGVFSLARIDGWEPPSGLLHERRKVIEGHGIPEEP
ncbi:MAG: hypothetical protein OXC82_00635 [Rhodobacteraceae bacterium]|nr:hypothetical protein [Paracoccaceae bacterium]MCY4248933.1 hypothetical protein [Paracoccaceae bacterium]